MRGVWPLVLALFCFLATAIYLRVTVIERAYYAQDDALAPVRMPVRAPTLERRAAFTGAEWDPSPGAVVTDDDVLGRYVIEAAEAGPELARQSLDRLEDAVSSWPADEQETVLEAARLLLRRLGEALAEAGAATVRLELELRADQRYVARLAGADDLPDYAEKAMKASRGSWQRDGDVVTLRSDEEPGRASGDAVFEHGTLKLRYRAGRLSLWHDVDACPEPLLLRRR